MKVSIFSLQKSQAQTRTSGNGGNRRKTRVMSDEEDMTMDDTNQVCLQFSRSPAFLLFICLVIWR